MQTGKQKPVTSKTPAVYFIFLAILPVSFFYPEILLPGMAAVSLVSAFTVFRMVKRYKAHGSSIFSQYSPKELMEYERHTASSSYRSKYDRGLVDAKWSNGFHVPCGVMLASLVLIVWRMLAISPVWLLLVCAWPLFILLCVLLEGVAKRIIPKPM